MPLCSKCKATVDFGTRWCPRCGVSFALTRFLHLASVGEEPDDASGAPDRRGSRVPLVARAISWAVVAVAGVGTLVLASERQTATALACLLGAAIAFGLLQAAAAGIHLLEEVRSLLRERGDDGTLRRPASPRR